MTRRRLALVLTALLALPLLAAGTAQGQAGDETAEGNGSGLLIEATPVFTSNDQARFTFEEGAPPVQPSPPASAEGSLCTGAVIEDPDATVTFTGFAQGTVVFPVGTPGGVYQLSVTCPAPAGPSAEGGRPTVSGTAFLVFARSTVTKVVEGDAPTDATFVVDLDCVADGPRPDAFGEGFFEFPPVTAQRTFGAQGGESDVILYGPYTCDLVESETGGAQSVTVETEDCEQPLEEATTGSFTIFGPGDCTQTVTNVFAADAADDGVVAATPTFTG